MSKETIIGAGAWLFFAALIVLIGVLLSHLERKTWIREEHVEFIPMPGMEDEPHTQPLPSLSEGALFEVAVQRWLDEVRAMPTIERGPDTRRAIHVRAMRFAIEQLPFGENDGEEEEFV